MTRSVAIKRVSTFLSLLLALMILASCSAAPQAVNPAQGVTDRSTSPELSSGSTTSGKSAAAPEQTSDQVGSSAASWNRMVIRTTNLAITVVDVESVLGSIRDIAQATESFVASSQTSSSGDSMTATITLQVPAVGFDGVVQQIRKLAKKVDSETTTSQDVTEEYIDLESQVKNLQASEQTMIRLLDRATTMSDILSIQKELTTVRGQIEKAQGRMNYISKRTDYSTVQIRISPESSAADLLGSSSWQPLRTISRAFQASIETLGEIVDVILTVVVFLWWLIPIVALAVWLWRRGRRNRRPAPAQAVASGGASTVAGSPPPAPPSTPAS